MTYTLAAGAANRAVTILRAALLVTLLVGVGNYVGCSIHWPLLVDSPIMHYINFLMDHGMRPYQEITDNNMPGAYIAERVAMYIFGGGDLAWRIYDYFLLLVLVVSMVIIAWPYDWMAGLYAGGLFALRHGSEGAWFAGEREQEMTVLLLASCACLFVSSRHRRPALTGAFGLLAGMAASIKPIVTPFAVVVLVNFFWVLRRQKRARWTYMLWGLGGVLSALMINLAFLWHYSAVRSFLFVLRTATPTYMSLNHPGQWFLIKHMAPSELIALGPLAMLALALHRKWNWERSVLLLGAGFGVLSYFLQQKGFFHHRYIFLAFGLMLVGLELMPATRRSGWSRIVGCAGILFPLIVSIPFYLHQFRILPNQSLLTLAMESDLKQFDVSRLQGEVQCFDMTFGCLNSLYHLGLVENTGYTGDLLLFTSKQSAAAIFYQQKFWKLQSKHPAAILVVTNQSFGKPNSFDRLEQWPEFVAYLEKNYTLVTTRSFPNEDKFRGQPPAVGTSAPAYRIYVRNDTSLLALNR